MTNQNSITTHDKDAADYDKQVKEYDSYTHDIIFGMCFDYIKPELKLLDIGIGTGLASEKFAKCGMVVSGVDGSEKMMNVCKEKNFTSELKLHDINILPLPYDKNLFDFVISCGVLHFFGDPNPIIKESIRLVKERGIFCFTYANQDEFTPKNDTYIEIPTPWNVSIFKQNSEHVKVLLTENGFEIIKKQKVLLKGSKKEDIEFVVLVTKSF